VKTDEALALANGIVAALSAGELRAADALLAPILSTRTPFRLLERIGHTIGDGPQDAVNPFLETIAAGRTEGGWVVIGGALNRQLDSDLQGALARCHGFVIASDVWYGADVLGERVPGPGLLVEFEPTLSLLSAWREDENTWVRRSVGVAVHFWAKRSRGAPGSDPQAKRLLRFLEPLFSEWDLNAVKGIGWGLKTLGRYYPELLVDWMAREVQPGSRRHRKLMLKKALTHLSNEQRTRAIGKGKE
jgi:hypothetical protein